MIQSHYQKTKETFRNYLEKKALTSQTIQRELMTLQLYLNWLNQEGIEPEDASYTDILAYMKHLSNKGIKQGTIQKYLNTLKHFYQYLAEVNRSIANPVQDITVKGVKRSKVYHILAPHELQEVYNSYSEQTPKGIRNKAILGLLINQGVKSEELAKLEVKSINLTDGSITIPATRKSSERTIELKAHQIISLNQYMAGVTTEKLFGNHLHNSLANLMYHLRKRYPGISVHQIRASVITKWIKQYNLRKVQYLAGHKYISSTEAYQKNDMEGLQEAVQQYHPLG